VIVVKLGGEVVAGPMLTAIAGDIATIAQKTEVVVVHGGGPQVTALQKRLGIEPQQIAGRRVTDAATLEVIKMAVAGQVNVDLCSALLAAGARPVGLHGASAAVIEAVRRPPRMYSGAGSEPIDLGLVGDVTAIGRRLIDLLTREGYVPVLACLGAGANGQAYNINADVVATKVAALTRADGLFLVSDVPGVLRDVEDPSSRFPELTVAEGRELIASGVVTRGMIPKLEESFAALAEGVRRIHVLGRLRPGDLAREVDSPGSVGTVLAP
jgi:acetylglutamate kinase